MAYPEAATGGRRQSLLSGSRIRAKAGTDIFSKSRDHATVRQYFYSDISL
jgi:predicted secreted protein